VEATEQLYPDRLTERVERLAYHAFRGEVWEKVVIYARQAGTKSLQRSSNLEAAAFFSNALDALARLPAASGSQELAIDLRFDLRLALMPLGEFARTLEVLREAEAAATELNDASRLGRVAARMTNLFWEMGEQDRAIESGLRALAIADSRDDGALGDMARRYLGCSHGQEIDPRCSGALQHPPIIPQVRGIFPDVVDLFLNPPGRGWSILDREDAHRGRVIVARSPQVGLR
jgi:tetratricopeptide (TPR) repeat protein